MLRAIWRFMETISDRALSVLAHPIRALWPPPQAVCVGGPWAGMCIDQPPELDGFAPPVIAPGGQYWLTEQRVMVGGVMLRCVAWVPEGPGLPPH